MNSTLPEGRILFPYPPHVAESVEDQCALKPLDKYTNLRIQAAGCQKIVVRMHWRDLNPLSDGVRTQTAEYDITTYQKFHDWYHTHFVLPLHCTFTYHGL